MCWTQVRFKHRIEHIGIRFAHWIGGGMPWSASLRLAHPRWLQHGRPMRTIAHVGLFVGHFAARTAHATRSYLYVVRSHRDQKFVIRTIFRRLCEPVDADLEDGLAMPYNMNHHQSVRGLLFHVHDGHEGVSMIIYRSAGQGRPLRRQTQYQHARTRQTDASPRDACS